jgi:NTP pyrophosphatase (non-canonical NTP hydrolase)
MNLRQVAAEMAPILDANVRQEAEGIDPLTRQVICAAEEMGEMVGAYRRWAGLARRKGTKEDLEQEIADVLIVTALVAHRAGIDIDTAVANKLKVIYSRGWKEE